MESSSNLYGNQGLQSRYCTDMEKKLNHYIEFSKYIATLIKSIYRDVHLGKCLTKAWGRKILLRPEHFGIFFEVLIACGHSTQLHYRYYHDTILFITITR